MGNQLTPFETCRREPLRDPNPNPRVPTLLCGRATSCGRACGADSRSGWSQCDPAGVFFDDTIRHLSDLDQMAFRFAASSNLAALRWLFVYGANSHVGDSNNTGLLHVAARTGSLHVVKDLVRRGCVCDSVDRAGWTPLHVATCMGRQDVAYFLLQSGADPESLNFKGQRAQDLCSNSGVKDVVTSYNTLHRLSPTAGTSELAGLGPGRSLHFEPFFVPREKILQDTRDKHIMELQKLGLDLFNASPGHGLAFLVATGVVPDYPVNINRFLYQVQASPERYGDFLGSDFPISQTLRLEFLNSLQLQGTGVVTALQAGFARAAVPKDWQKVDRLLRGISHFWWTQHLEEYKASRDDKARGFTQPTAGSSSSTSAHSEELGGLRLFRSLVGPEGFYRLLYSTVMLHQWLKSGHQLTFNEWTQLNMCIDEKGTDVPMHVQRGIYDALVCGDMVLARPFERDAARPVVSPVLEGWASIRFTGRAQVSYDGETAAWFQQPPRVLAAQGGVTSAGRASLAPMGLQTLVDEEVDDDFGAFEMPQSVVTEPPQASNAMPVLDDNEERAWMSLHSSVLLLAPAPDELPYAFVPLTQVTHQALDATTGHFSLTGKSVTHAPMLKESKPTMNFLELCLLLHDGRYQLLEAPQLDIRVAATEYESWVAHLQTRTCGENTTTYRV